MENINQVIEFIKSCSLDDFNILRQTVQNRILANRAKARLQIEVGSIVTSDHPKWPGHLGNATVIKVNRKRTKIKFKDGSVMNASHELLKPVKIESDENMEN